jgi:uncharacterized protein (TIGR03382 family)
MSEHGMTDLDYITKHDLADYNALVIEQTGEHGQPVVLADFTSDLADLALAANRALGCGGCDSTSTGGAAGVAGALIALAARRRRR